MDNDLIYALMLTRLNRLAVDKGLETLLRHTIDAAQEELAQAGIRLNSSPLDVDLVVNVAVDKYMRRDKDTGRPEWLRYAIRQRWLAERRCADGIG